MIEQEEFFVAVIALLVVYLGILMRFQAKLLDLLDELAFPSDDPIMTSELDRGKPVFDYTTVEEEAEETPLDDTPEEAVELTPEEEEVIEEVMAKEEPEVFDYEEVPEAPEEPEPEIFTEGLETRRTISFFEPDFPPLTLAQLKRLPKAELIDLCEKYGHDTSGTKNDLFKRLVN